MQFALENVLHEDPDGIILVGSTRVSLDSVVYAFWGGDSPEAIVVQFPALTLPDVYGALAVYLKNRKEVDEYLNRQQATAQKLRQEMERRFPQDGLRARLLARQAESA